MRSKINAVKFGLCRCLALAIVVAGCAPVYVPSARHTHQLDTKGEVSVSAFTGTSGADVQAAYAITDHIGVLGSGSWFGSQEEEGDYLEHTYGELGLQYHYTMGQRGRVEFMGGYGRGSSTSGNSNSEVYASGTYNKFGSSEANSLERVISKMLQQDFV